MENWEAGSPVQRSVKDKDVVNTRSPFAEANSLFKNGVLQGEGYAMLYDLTEYLLV